MWYNGSTIREQKIERQIKMKTSKASVQRAINQAGDRKTFEYQGNIYTALVSVGKTVKASMGDQYFRFPVKWFLVDPATNQISVQAPTV